MLIPSIKSKTPANLLLTLYFSNKAKEIKINFFFVLKFHFLKIVQKIVYSVGRNYFFIFSLLFSENIALRGVGIPTGITVFKLIRKHIG